MKTSSVLAPPKLCDRTSARNHLLTNLLVLPGLGSWLAGQRFAGVLQAALALTGFGLTAFGLITFLSACLRAQSFPMSGVQYLLQGMLGVVLFLASWLWALVTNLAILRRLKQRS